MRSAHRIRLGITGLLAGLAALASPAVAQTRDKLASPPVDISVTVYRDPYREKGGFDLDSLQGFALVTETRRILLQPGQTRLRFEGVADGIEPASAIITGLPSGVIEKNRDAKLLSPNALVESAQSRNGRVLITRADPATGVRTRREGVIRSDAGGVVIETPDGIEALRCSGMPEAFEFDATTTGLSALPTLSVMTRTDKPLEAVVQLSYLARGFDWSADYTAAMSAGKFDLGAWVTLANGNGTGFRDARVQIVAGTLNRESGEVEPIELGRPILASCWPRGNTSMGVPPIYIEQAYPLGYGPDSFAYPMPAPAAPMAERVVVTGSMLRNSPEDAAKAVEAVSQEELGDLKLYRVPSRTTLASRQSKQVRLLDKPAVPVTKLYEIDYFVNQTIDYQPATTLLRTRNDAKSNLGVPLPSGRIALFETAGAGADARRLLSAETGVRDYAVDEEIELRISQSPDVQIRQTEESRTIAGPAPPPLPWLPGVDRRRPLHQTTRIDISNARPVPIQLEIRLRLYDNQILARSDRPAAQKNGRPIIRLTIPANSEQVIRYQTTER